MLEHERLYSTHRSKCSPITPRLEKQMQMFDLVTELAKKAGCLDDMFFFGGFANPTIQGTRNHSDVDCVVRGKEVFSRFYNVIVNNPQGKFKDCSSPFLHGSSLFFLRPDWLEDCGELELRYVTREVRNGAVVWTHDIPEWASEILGKPLVIPDSAFSLRGERWNLQGRDVRFLLPEYSLVTKMLSRRPKDLLDIKILRKSVNPRLVQYMIDQVKKAGALFILPPEMMDIPQMIDLD